MVARWATYVVGGCVLLVLRCALDHREQDKERVRAKEKEVREVYTQGANSRSYRLCVCVCVVDSGFGSTQISQWQRIGATRTYVYICGVTRSVRQHAVNG